MTNIYAHISNGDAPKSQHVTEVSFVDENGKHVDIGGGGTGTMVTPSNATYDKPVDFNDITTYGVYDVRTTPGSANGPVDTSLNGGMLVIPAGYNGSVFQIVFSRDTNLGVFIRAFSSFTSTWTGWNKIAFMSDIPNASALTSHVNALGATDNMAANQLKTKIDTTSTDLNAVKSDLSDFKTTTNRDIAALQSKDTDLG